MRMLSQEEETDDVEVTWEDQSRINTFSKLNARVKVYEEKMVALKQEKEALDDISAEMFNMEEDKPVMYRIGEAFVHLPLPRAMKRLENDQEAVESELSQVSSKVEECEKEMKELKVSLYAKFGKAINLDE